MGPLPPDVRRLVIAARKVAFEDQPSREALKELDGASEAFADRVPWEDEPEKTGDSSTLCEDCPPVGYPTDKTRCLPCPRRT